MRCTVALLAGLEGLVKPPTVRQDQLYTEEDGESITEFEVRIPLFGVRTVPASVTTFTVRVVCEVLGKYTAALITNHETTDETNRKIRNKLETEKQP
jgi:hypothetical protein